MKETVKLHAKGGETVWETQVETGPDVKRYEIVLDVLDGPLVVTVEADKVDSVVNLDGEIFRLMFYRRGHVVAEYFVGRVVGWREV